MALVAFVALGLIDLAVHRRTEGHLHRRAGRLPARGGGRDGSPRHGRPPDRRPGGAGPRRRPGHAPAPGLRRRRPAHRGHAVGPGPDAPGRRPRERDRRADLRRRRRGGSDTTVGLRRHDRRPDLHPGDGRGLPRHRGDLVRPALAPVRLDRAGGRPGGILGLRAGHRRPAAGRTDAPEGPGDSFVPARGPPATAAGRRRDPAAG